jgi:hypothetical protein
MTANEVLIRLTEKQIDGVFRAARALPADKLDWKPAPGARSALDQLQEIATALAQFEQIYEEKKIDFDEAKFGKWVEERSKITSIDELEARCRKETAGLIDRINKTDPANFSDPVDLPFPGGPYTYVDVLGYHYWNCSYHEGQINYIASLLE